MTIVAAAVESCFCSFNRAKSCVRELQRQADPTLAGNNIDSYHIPYVVARAHRATLGLGVEHWPTLK